MDINELLTQAKKNKKEISKVNRYSTNVKPAKKLQRTVDPVAIKAFLDKKKTEEIKSATEASKKKEKLKKLRDNSKTTRKANSMAKRTKDNLKVYKGEDVLGLYPEPRKRRRGEHPSPPLSPEADRKHKAFMKNIIPKVKVPGVNDDDSDDDEYKEPVLEQDERKMRKLEKKRAKARSASNLEFGDLLQLAEKHKNKIEDSSSSSSEESDSAESDSDNDRFGKPLTAEEKYQRERRKRRELEERLKAASTQKRAASSTGHGDHHKQSISNPLSNFKIGKLKSGMSEESKRAKVKVLLEKLKKSSEGRSTEEKSDKKRVQSSSKPTKKSSSEPSLQDLKQKKNFANNSKHKNNGVRGENSKVASHHAAQHHRKSSTPDPKNSPRVGSSAIASRKKKLKPYQTPTDSELRQTKIDPHLKKKVPFGDKKRSLSAKAEKCTSNPYKHTVVKQNRPLKRPATETLEDPGTTARKGSVNNPVKRSKPAEPPGKCTLSVTSESVRTNYPGVAREDPYIREYKKSGKVLPKFTPEMFERYKAAIVRKLRAEGRLPIPGSNRPPARRPHGAPVDEFDDEYDSELEDFIADEEDEDAGGVDISSHIRQIFGYDKSKYGRESEWELSKMDASYKDIEKEEKRSLRIAREEDAREAKLEEERMRRSSKKHR